MVSSTVKTESKYRSAFQRLTTNANGRELGWFERLRTSAMDQFEQLGFPTVQHEEWKYTNLAPLAKLDLEPVISASPLPASDLQQFVLPESANNQIVLVNGILQSQLSVTEAENRIVAMELTQALSHPDYSDVVREHLGRGADYNASAPTALNTAFISSGAFILIPANIRLETPLHLMCVSDPVEPELAAFPRILVVAEENSSATLIETYGATKERRYFNNAVVEVVLKSGAWLDHFRVQRENVEAYHIASTTVDLGRDSSYNSTAITLGGKLSRHDISVLLDHEGAECWVDGLYLVGSGQHADTHSVIDHRKPHCSSHQLYKGILDGKSRAVFNGKIFVRHGAQKTDAMQTNKNLLLSTEAHVDTKPQLEIFADDVKCAHGAAVGQIDEEELFYLETRGINPDLGRNLLTYGFAEEVVGKITVDSMRTQLEHAVLNRLNAREGMERWLG